MTSAAVHAPPRISSGAKAAGLALLLFSITFAIFSPTLQYGLVDLDDQLYVSNNPLVMEGFSVSQLRVSLFTLQQGLYAPLLWISYGLDAAVLNASPTTPGGFHFTNVLLHAFNSALLFLLLFAFCKKPWRAFFFAALWALHPLRVESVAWVTERKDVLSGFFGLLCLGTYIQAFSTQAGSPPDLRPRLPYYVGSVLLLALGLLVKPSLVPIPGALLLLDVWPLRRVALSPHSVFRAAPRLLAEKIPFLLLAALAAFGASHAHKAMHALNEVPFATRLFSIPIHYAFYLAKSVWPCNLSPLYPDRALTGPALAFSVLLRAGLTIWTWITRFRHPSRFIGWLFFLGFLMPAIGWIRFGVQSIADRFTYFPAIGLSIALLNLWPSGETRRNALRGVRAVVALGLLALLAGTTLQLLPAWRSPSSFHAHILSVYPDNVSALEMRSFHMIRTAGDFRTANDGFDRILQTGVFNHNVLGGKARCLAALQGPAAAKAALLQAPGTGNPYAMHALAWEIARYSLMLRQYDDAIRYARRALESLPDSQTVPVYLHLLIMVAAFEKGDMPLAMDHARRFPAYADKTSLEFADLLPYYLHQWTEFHRADAYAYLRQFVQSHPDQPGLLNNVAWGLATAEWSPAPPADVLALAQQVCAAFPQANPGALDTLAAAQANAGDFPAACQTIQQALALLSGAGQPELVQFQERLQARLALYRKRQPYREEAFSRLLATQFGKGLAVTQKAAP